MKVLGSAAFPVPRCRGMVGTVEKGTNFVGVVLQYIATSALVKEVKQGKCFITWANTPRPFLIVPVLCHIVCQQMRFTLLRMRSGCKGASWCTDAHRTHTSRKGKDKMHTPCYSFITREPTSFRRCIYNCIGLDNALKFTVFAQI